MGIRARLLLLIIGLYLSPGTALAREPVTVGVLQFSGKGGISKEKEDLLLEFLAEQIAGLGDIEVVTRADIREMLNLEKLRRLAGCSDERCFSEISGALGVRWMVTGNVSLFGKMYVLNLKLVDARTVLVAGRVSRMIRGDEEDLLDALPGAIQELFGGVGERLGLSIQKRVTVATRYAKPLSQSPSAVWVITREDIEASGADSVPNLLRLVPGMNVVVSSSYLQSITSRLRWNIEGQEYLVMIDGREINFDPLGFPPWETEPVFLEDIERIEVIRGPASALYGANAFAGVVSITTRALPGRASAGISMNLGEAGGTMTRMRASTPLGDWGLGLWAQADFMGQYLNPRKSAEQAGKFRSRLERRWSESKRFLVDAGISFTKGPLASAMGTVQSEFDPMSVRLAYESPDLNGQLYWIYARVQARIDTPLEYAGSRLATFVPAPMESHVVDAQIQWTPPVFWEPLRIVAGGGSRASWFGSKKVLDADTFTDPTSPHYHQPGISHWEIRGGAFVHAEYALADWVTVTGGARLDYDTQTGWFMSPRLAAVFQPADNHFLRATVARSFRKPSFIETLDHLMVEFPEDSPIQGPAQDQFQEFMTRIGGNRGLDNEELLAFEMGYAGRFLEGRIKASLDLYYNRFRNQILLFSNIVEDEHGLPDLRESSFMFFNRGPDLDVLGCELSVAVNLSRSVSLLASWTHQQVYDYSSEKFSDENPKNLIALGGRFRTDGGLLGSLFAFSRSDFWDRAVENPAGLLQPLVHKHLDNVVLLIGKLGRRMELGQHVQMEVGVKLFLPVSFQAPRFRYYEAGGGVTPGGQMYGAEQLGRVVTGYLEGAF